MVYGQMIGKYPILHEGSHNDMGNPHSQYSFPILKVGQASTVGQYTKIFSTEEIEEAYKCHLFLKAELIYFREDGKNAGELMLHVTRKTDGTFKTEVIFDNDNNADMFSVYKRSIGSKYVIELYLKSSVVSDQLKFVPILCDLSLNKDWVAHQNTWMQRSRFKFYESQPYVSSIPDTLLGVSLSKKVQSKNVVWESKDVTSGAIIDCTNLATAKLNYSAPGTITGFSNFTEGQIVTLHSVGTNAVTIEHNSTTRLKGSANVTLTIGQNITLRRVSTLWVEI